MTHVRHDDGEFGVEGVVDFADGAFVTPEGVVILTVLGVRVPDGGEQLVPGCGVGVGLRDAVGGLPASQKQTLLTHLTSFNNTEACQTPQTEAE